jgi:hypothetical protein
VSFGNPHLPPALTPNNDDKGKGKGKGNDKNNGCHNISRASNTPTWLSFYNP